MLRLLPRVRTGGLEVAVTETSSSQNGPAGSASSREPGAGSREPGAGSREPGAGSRRDRLKRWVGHGILILALALLFGIGLWASAHYDLSISLEPVVLASPSDAATYQPAYDRVEGDQLVQLFVGSSTCRWSADPDLPAIVESLKVRFAEYAARHDLGFRATANILDWVPESGLAFLESFGAFDEIAVGGSWSGHGLVRQTWDHGLPPTTPAVYILWRHLAVEGDSLGVNRIGLDQERVLLHRRGVSDMRSLANQPPEQSLDARMGVALNGSEP